MASRSTASRWTCRGCRRARRRSSAQNNDGILFLFKKNKVAFFHGRGAFAGGGADAGWTDQGRRAARNRRRARRDARDRRDRLRRPAPLPGVAFDNVRVLDNAGALAMTEVPKRLGVVGAGVIGLRDGQRVATAGRADDGAGSAARLPSPPRTRRSRRKRSGRSRSRASRSTPASRSPVSTYRPTTSWSATPTPKARRSATTFDRLIVSIGRVPHTAGLGAATVGLGLDERGFVAVDGDCRTNLGNVWAIGDVVRGPDARAQG